MNSLVSLSDLADSQHRLDRVAFPGVGKGIREQHLLGLLPNFHYVEHGGRAVRGASVRRTSCSHPWNKNLVAHGYPAFELYRVTGHPKGRDPCDGP